MQFFQLFFRYCLAVDNLPLLPYNCGMTNDSKKPNMPRLFVCKLANKVQPLPHIERQEEIDGCKNALTRLEKYTSWQLLRHAVETTFGVPMDMFDIHKNHNGKWVCNYFFLSISHSNGLCAVAIDNAPIGIDLQKSQPQKFNKKLLKRIACENELKQLCGDLPRELPEWNIFVPYADGKKILSLWCKKEALFKKLDLPAFVTRNLDTTIARFVETSFTHDNAHYHHAIATAHHDIQMEWVEVE